jgi:hypothetical protein
MSDIHRIRPHIAVKDGVLSMPVDDDGRRGIMIFASRTAAEEMSPPGYFPVSVSVREIEKLSEALHVWLVALVGLDDDELDGSKQGDGARLPRAPGPAVRRRTGLRRFWHALCGIG